MTGRSSSKEHRGVECNRFSLLTPLIYCILPIWVLSLGAVSSGCLSRPPASPPATADQTPATDAPVEPPPTPTEIAVACADMDAQWGHNWPGVLATLEGLIAAGQRCGDEPLLSKKYAVHFNYGASLEGEGQIEAAVAQYQAALAIDPQRAEALAALIRLEALPDPTPPTCLSDSPPYPDPAPAATPDPAGFVTAQGRRLQLAGRPFTIRGVNYYPRHAPWERFFSEAEPAAMAQELAVIKQSGFNTLRIFLWYRPLFTCQPDEAIPNETAFELIDTLFRLAAEQDLKLILTLNDLPDLLYRPLYTDWDHYDAQTVYIVRRYRNEPALLAWDVRNGPDFDYGPDSRFSEAEVIEWLAHITGLIRANDPGHLLTTGWAGDPTAAAPYVDILSFQYWEEPAGLPARLEAYQQAGAKPLLLLSTGYHSWAQAPDAPQTEQDQAAYLKEITGLVEQEALAGWLIWTAFDFVPAPGRTATAEHHFGLWRTDLSPKPALEALSRRP